MLRTLQALSAMRTLMQAWSQMKWTGQFHPIPFFPFRQLLIYTTRISQAITYFFMILNKRYLTARVYLTQKPCSHPKTSLPPASRKSHVEESCDSPPVEEWEARVLKERDTIWILFSMLIASHSVLGF